MNYCARQCCTVSLSLFGREWKGEESNGHKHRRPPPPPPPGGTSQRSYVSVHAAHTRPRRNVPSLNDGERLAGCAGLDLLPVFVFDCVFISAPRGDPYLNNPLTTSFFFFFFFFLRTIGRSDMRGHDSDGPGKLNLC